MKSLQCPQCQTPIEQDFGVITCHHCGAVLMVDIEGHIQLADGSPRQEAPDFEVNPSDLDSGLESLLIQELNIENENENAPSESDSLPDFEPISGFSQANADESNFKEEILDFANSDLHAGALSYSLVIEKIDGGELRSALREILSDPKLRLEVDQLMRSISGGRLEIKDLNSIKTSLIVQKVRRFPFAISWSQYAFSS